MRVSSTCVLSLGADSVELRVLRDDPAWLWEVRFVSGKILDSGAAATRVAAKMAAQNALEHRLKRAGYFKRHHGGYRWRNMDATS